MLASGEQDGYLDFEDNDKCNKKLSTFRPLFDICSLDWLGDCSIMIIESPRAFGDSTKLVWVEMQAWNTYTAE